jgi:transcriptional regulator GlxA family with amidase domain
MDMMRTGHEKLADIALEGGFQDFRTFERAFKKHPRLTPLDVKPAEPTPLLHSSMAMLSSF